jgi:uncharacterized Ntn-hydrolase superfamily protein
MTYSIVALDPITGDLGVAVQTRWFGVGAWVPWVEAGVGVVATQSFTEPGHGWNGLRLMREGRSAPEALAAVLAADADEAVRQVGIVDALGRSAAHTGARCVRFASHLTEPGISVQANMMERATVPAAMLAAFRAARGPLAGRLFAALEAAEGEGGDVRGRQSAALVVAPGQLPDGSAPPPWSRVVDLRVDDHRAPLDELARLLRLDAAYEAMGAAERASLAGDAAAAIELRAQSVELAPDDDMVLLWSAVDLALAGRDAEARAAFAAASAVEPRSGEQLRRFAEAGHLSGGDAVPRVLGMG